MRGGRVRGRRGGRDERGQGKRVGKERAGS